MFHRSDRLLLRPIWPEDWQGILAGIADEGVVRNLASAPWPYDEADARDFTSLPIEPMYPRFLVTRAADADILGCIGLDPTPADDGAAPKSTVELGYWIARSHWGRGYASEAGRAVVSIAKTLGYRRMIASHFIDNPASGAVLTKLGFAPTGRVVERHSRARGEAAKTTEYALALSGEPVAV